MKDVFMEQEDFVRMKDAEIAALREELDRERARRASAEHEAEICFESARLATKENLQLKKRLQSWADDADAVIAAARKAELEALEL